MGNTSCCQEEVPTVPKEVVETQHACEEPEIEAKSGEVKADILEEVHGSDPQSPKSHSIILKMPQFDVDAEIMRGIELQDSLRRVGKLWRESPLDLKIEERRGLWEKSRPVEEYDVFLSHTWLTPGRWKVLSLSLQSGWKQMWLVWFLSMSVVLLLGSLGVLPAPFRWAAGTLGYRTPTPFGPWMLATSFFSMILGLALVPYTPAFCRKSSICFLDVACIHQTDQELMARGVYGLGGFLRKSAELRVLWSTPYLTRLWCVFELAAYHVANPDGKVTLCPLFVEIGLVIMFVGSHAVSGFSEILMVTSFFGDWDFVAYFVGVLPVYIILHLLRDNIRKKHHLIASLEAFALSAAQCRNDFDREFIHNAIRAWYGSEKAFENLVRHNLKDELQQMAFRTQIPLSYIGMVAVAVVSSTLDCIMSLLRGNAPAEVILTHFIGVTIGQSFFWFLSCLTLLLYLCDRWAFPVYRDWNHFTTLLIFLAFFVSFYVGALITEEACERSFWLAAAWCAFTLLTIVFLRRGNLGPAPKVKDHGVDLEVPEA